MSNTRPVMPSPQLFCRQLARFDLDDWPRMDAALANAAVCELRQAWLLTPQPDLRPTRVRTGWTPTGLALLADLADDDIFNPITGFNEPGFQHGDAFEIFLQPAGQAAYYELHVTPRNQQFQLRIPSSAAFHANRDSGSGSIDGWKVSAPISESRAAVLPEQKLWRVAAFVPFAKVVEDRAFAPGETWKFSFSRYDYTRGCKKPVLSSSSAHAECNFHRVREWGALCFAPPVEPGQRGAAAVAG